MNAKNVYDAISYKERKNGQYTDASAELRLFVNYSYYNNKDGSINLSKKIEEDLKKQILNLLYGRIDDILSKYDRLIFEGLSSIGAQQDYFGYKCELSDFFNRGKE